MNTIWFLIIVFFTSSGHAYMDRGMFPRKAPSERACLIKADEIRKIHAEIQASDSMMDDAEVFCWGVTGIPQLQDRLRNTYKFVGNPP